GRGARLYRAARLAAPRRRRPRLVRRGDPANLAAVERGALPGKAFLSAEHAPGPRPPPGSGRGDPGRLALSARSAGALATAAVVSSTPGRRQQFAARRSLGQ